MSQRLLSWTAFVQVVVSMAACGTEVKVGRNSNPSLFASDSDEFLAASSDATGGGASLNLGCFGQVPDAAMPATIVDLCASTPESIRSDYAKIFATLCDERRLVNLVQPECGWDGASELGRHLQVLERTDLDATEIKEFDFYAAGSATLTRTMDEYLQAFYRGYEDPEFRARLKVYDKVKLTDVVVDRDTGRIDYTVEIKSSAATVGFTGEIHVIKYDSGLVAIFDRAVRDLRIVKENRFVTLLAPAVDGQLVVALIDQKKIDDLGNHRIAFSTSIKFDKERLELMHAMAASNESAYD